MECKNCKSDRIMIVSGKTSDCFSSHYPKAGLMIDDYPPTDMGIGGNDYMEFDYCLECGTIQGKFPVRPDFDEWNIS